LLGAQFEQPMLRHAKRALRLVAAVSLLSAAAAILIQRARK
jgi:hypothetical protein